MDAKDLFLSQHAAVQSVAVGGNPVSAAERAFGGLSDAQMRVRPREDLNSLAWIMWHIARAEDIMVNALVAGREQGFDDAGAKRLRISRRDVGIGMASPGVTDLTRALDLATLREYGDAVGRRTREIVAGFRDSDWGGEVAGPAVQKAAADGAFGSRAEQMVKAFT